MMKDGTFNKEALGEKVALYANKLASNRFIAAIRDAFASTIPITITAAFFLLINNVLLTEETGLLRGIPGRAMEGVDVKRRPTRQCGRLCVTRC
mgnify:CR=1 FL=1